MKSIRPPRLSQETPEVMVSRLLGLVRGQFCGDLPDKEWFQQTGFLRVKVILWPARFMAGKGFTLPPARYEAILRGVLAEIKHHGQTGQVRYWPGYLMKCVQDHWKHHWEEYYQEAKSVRTLAESLVVACGRTGAEDRGVEALALAHRVLAGRRPKNRTEKAQLTLL
jgi:hypothetical protein